MKNKYIKILLGFVAAIIIGAIGSGLWERILSKIFDYIIELTINIMNLFITSYKDSIYASASKGFHEFSATYLHSLVLALIPALYMVTLSLYYKIRHRENKKEEKPDSRLKKFMFSKKGNYALIFITIAAFISCMIGSFKLIYTNDVATYSFRCMEIIAPYLSDQEIKEIRSQYYMIKNAKDFSEFDSKIKGIASKNNIVLPKLEI